MNMCSCKGFLYPFLPRHRHVQNNALDLPTMVSLKVVLYLTITMRNTS